MNCECGCGQEFERVPTKGAPLRYIPGHQFRAPDTFGAYLEGKKRQRRTPPADYPTHGLCHCGCGSKTEIVTRSNIARGWYIGFPKMYIHGHNPRGLPHPKPRPKPARRKNGEYWEILAPEHPYTRRDGYVREHRLVWEQANGRVLEPHEIIHHMNHDKEDNRPENLILVTKAEHRSLHRPHDNITDESRQKLSEATRRAWADGRMRKGK